MSGVARQGCAEQVSMGRGGLAPCSRRGVVYATKADFGITKRAWWCKQHSPAATAARNAAREARYRKQREADDKRWKRIEAEHDLMHWARKHKGALVGEAVVIVRRYEQTLKG